MKSEKTKAAEHRLLGMQPCGSELGSAFAFLERKRL
jgi:hypothetical protein